MPVSTQLKVQPPADATSRRALLTRVAAAAPLAAVALPAFAGPKDGLQDGKSVNEWGADDSGLLSPSLLGSSGAPGQAGRKGGTIPKIRTSGTWNDPAHPGCTRKIVVQGKTAFISGADEDGKPWCVSVSQTRYALRRPAHHPLLSASRSFKHHRLTRFFRSLRPYRKVKGTVDGNSIIVDFTPKGGPSGVEAKFVVGKGLVFPDGNVWTNGKA